MDIAAIIETGLKNSGLSAAEASRRAFGNPYFLYGILKKGQIPSIDKFEKLCHVLGISMRIGAPRGAEIQLSSDLAVFSRPIEARRDTLDTSAVQDKLREAAKVIDELKAEAEAKAKAVKKYAPRATPTDALRSEVRDDALIEAGDISARPVMVMELAAAAGSGSVVLDETHRDPVYFRRAWLGKHALDPTQCRVIGVVGDSMDPTLPDGCRILVDFKRRRRLSDHIFVLRTADGVVVKRLARNGGTGWVLVSDNDSPDWPDTPWPDEAELIGEVKWMAQTF